MGHRLIDTMKKFMSVDIRHECTISSMIDHERSELSIMLGIVQITNSKDRLNVLTFFIHRPIDFGKDYFYTSYIKRY